MSRTRNLSVTTRPLHLQTAEGPCVAALQPQRMDCEKRSAHDWSFRDVVLAEIVKSIVYQTQKRRVDSGHAAKR